MGRTTLVSFLKLLAKVKAEKDIDGSPHACFGCYDSRSGTCYVNRHGADPLCGICYEMQKIASDDWIEKEINKLESVAPTDTKKGGEKR